MAVAFVFLALEVWDQRKPLSGDYGPTTDQMAAVVPLVHEGQDQRRVA